jgi:hypothetical protein
MAGLSRGLQARPGLSYLLPPFHLVIDQFYGLFFFSVKHWTLLSDVGDKVTCESTQEVSLNTSNCTDLQ